MKTVCGEKQRDLTFVEFFRGRGAIITHPKNTRDAIREELLPRDATSMQPEDTVSRHSGVIVPSAESTITTTRRRRENESASAHRRLSVNERRRER